MGNTHCLLSTLPNSSEENVWASPVGGSSVQVTGLAPDVDAEHSKSRAGRSAADGVSSEAGIPLPALGRSPNGVFFLDLDGPQQDQVDEADRTPTWWCPRCRCPVVQEFDESRGVTFRVCPSCQRWEQLASDGGPAEGDRGGDFGDEDLDADDFREHYGGDGGFVGAGGVNMSGHDGVDPRYYADYSHDVRECPFCHDLVEVSHFDLHVETCEENVRHCPFCTHDVQAFGFHEHVAECAEICTGRRVGSICPFCRCAMQAASLHQHVPRCHMNTRQCPFCNEQVRADTFHTHVPQCQQHSREANFEYDDLGGACGGGHREYGSYENRQDAFGGVGDGDEGSFDSEEELFSDQGSSGSWEGEDRDFSHGYHPPGGNLPEDGQRFDGRGNLPEDGQRFDGRGTLPEDGQRFDGRGADGSGPEDDGEGPSVCPAAAVVIAQIRQDLGGLEAAPLKSKLRRLQLKWHPDKAKGDPAVVHDVFCFVQAEWERNFG